MYIYIYCFGCFPRKKQQKNMLISLGILLGHFGYFWSTGVEKSFPYYL